MKENPTVISAAKRIVIDCERMKYPHTGLYHFCLQLGRSLLQEAEREEFFFFVAKKNKDIFGRDTQYIQQHFAHKLLLPDTRRFDVWHVTHQGSPYFPDKRKIPIVLTVHDLNFMKDHSKSPDKKRKYLKELQHKTDRADHIVAISQFVLDDLRQHIHLRNKPTTVIYNGCNISKTVIATEPVVKPATPFLFTIGTIAAKKNFHVLPSLLINNNLQLVIAGITQDESYKKQVVAAAQKAGVSDRVHFTGPVSENEKYWYYKHCEALVFPSLAEGFGLPVIEAMYFGKPVFLSTHTSLPEIGGTAAFYFPDFETETMQMVFENGMKQYADTKMMQPIIQHASRFNWAETARQYLSVYRSLC